MSDRNRSEMSSQEVILILMVLVLMLVGGGALFMWRASTSLRAESLRAQQQAMVAAAQAQAAKATMQSPINIDRMRNTDFDDWEAAIHQLLQSQVDAWNMGDIDGLMESYWNSDQLTFCAGGNVTRSWQSISENYKSKYATPAEMGRLTFENLELSPQGERVVLVLGEWQLQREKEPEGGNFSLVLRRIDGQWLIVHHHNSKENE